MGLKSRQKRDKWKDVDSWLRGDRDGAPGAEEVMIATYRKYTQRTNFMLRKQRLALRRIVSERKFPPKFTCGLTREYEQMVCQRLNLTF